MANVLVMEDDTEAAVRVSDMLLAMGHDMTLARTASEALAVLKHTTFDLVITDIFVIVNGVAKADGGILLIGRMRQVHAVEGGPDLRKMPILAVTGAQGYVHRREVLGMAESVGADASLGKPFEESEFRAVIDGLLLQGARA